MEARLQQIEQALRGLCPWTGATLLVAGFAVGAAAAGGRIDEERVLRLLERLFNQQLPTPEK